jgi:hypothetical protein
MTSMYKNAAHCHERTHHNILRLGSKLLSSSGEGTVLSVLVRMENVLVTAADATYISDRLVTFQAELPRF